MPKAEIALKDSIKFVYSAVADKSAIPEYSHISIRNGYALASNGVLSLGAPVEIGFNSTLQAEALVKALGVCKSILSLSENNRGGAVLSSGKFSANISSLAEVDSTLYGQPSGNDYEVDGEKLLSAFQSLEKFVNIDTLRPWTNGILLRGHSAYATNNVCLVEYWLGAEVPLPCNVPLSAVKLVCKQGTAPVRVLTDARTITFMYSSGRWIKTLLYEEAWPPVETLLNIPTAEATEISSSFYEGVAALCKLGYSRVYFSEGKLCSDMDSRVGASYAVDGLEPEGIYSLEALRLLEGTATHASFSRYPNNIGFYGKNMRGVLVSMRA